MEQLRRPSVLAAIAAAVLAINLVVVLANGDDAGVTVDDVVAGEDVDASESPGTAAGDGSEAGQPDDGATTTDGGTATGNEDGEGDGSGDGDGDGAEQPAGAGGLAVPTAGTYTYASSGSWSLTTNGTPEEQQLPATATATVVVDGQSWDLRLQAGERYADRFGFALGSDGGLDWTDWVLERTFGGQPSETAYTCSGDSAHYRPDEQGRVATHTCQGPGITSEGRIEHLGSEDVTLGDGTVVTADRLLYSYEVSGDGVSGDGQLGLWLDPATGLRVQETRTIATTTTSGTTTFEYREDVQFTLQALDPS